MGFAALNPSYGLRATCRHTTTANIANLLNLSSESGAGAGRRFCGGPLERNLVVEIGVGGAAARRRGGGGSRAAEAAGIAFVVAALRRPGCAAAVAGAVEHRQIAAEAGQHHLGRGALLALLVGPFAGLQLALDI